MASMSRQDAHRARVFVAADYSYLDSIDLYENSEELGLMAAGMGKDEWDALRRHLDEQRALKQQYRARAVGDNRSLGQCSVCGAHIRYAAIWEHIPTGGIITTGEDCAANISEVQAGDLAAKMGALREWATRLTEWGKLARVRAEFLAVPENAAALEYIVALDARHAVVRDAFDEATRLADEHARALNSDHTPEGSRAACDFWREWENREGNALRTAANREYDSFLFDLLGKFRRYGYLTERQVAAVHRTIERRAERALQDAQRDATRGLSQHVGTVGQRLVMDVTVTFTKYIESDFGGKQLIGMVDDTGNSLRTFASGAFAWDAAVVKGARLSIKATVKAHDEYQGERQTMLTRVALVAAGVAA